MFYARKPLVRSACLIVAAAASFVTLSSGLPSRKTVAEIQSSSNG